MLTLCLSRGPQGILAYYFQIPATLYRLKKPDQEPHTLLGKPNREPPATLLGEPSPQKAARHSDANKRWWLLQRHVLRRRCSKWHRDGRNLWPESIRQAQSCDAATTTWFGPVGRGNRSPGLQGGTGTTAGRSERMERGGGRKGLGRAQKSPTIASSIKVISET